MQHIVNGLGFRIRPVLHFVLGQRQGEGDGLPSAGIEQSAVICEYLHVYFTAVVNKGQNVVKGTDFAQGGQVAQQLPVEKDGLYQAVNLYPRVKGDEPLVGGEKIGASSRARVSGCSLSLSEELEKYCPWSLKKATQ